MFYVENPHLLKSLMCITADTKYDTLTQSLTKTSYLVHTPLYTTIMVTKCHNSVSKGDIQINPLSYLMTGHNTRI